MPSIILSGIATHIANMPHLVQQLTLLNPMRYFLIILRCAFFQRTPFQLLIGQWPMAIIGPINLTVAGRMFRDRMD